MFSGVDGSGKLTISRFLVSYLFRYGFVCRYWFRGSHLFASVLVGFFRVSGFLWWL